MHWLSPLLYGSEIWTLRGEKADINWDGIFSEEQPDPPFFPQKWKEEVLEEFKAEPADEKLRRYKTEWLRHVTVWTAAGWGNECWIVDGIEEDDLGDLWRPMNSLLEEAETGL